MAMINMEDYFYTEGQDLYWKVRQGRSPAGSRAGRYTGKQKHRQVTVEGKRFPVSHVVWYLHNKYWPKMIDHIDRNPENNSIENLRECDHKFNGANRTKGNIGYKGVQFYQDKLKPWKVTVGKNYIGYFDSELEAKAAYYGAAKILYGNFATYGEES